MGNYYLKFCQFVVPWIAAALIFIAIGFSSGSQPAALALWLITLPLCFFHTDDRIKVSGLFIFILIWPLIASIPLFIGSQTGEALAGAARYFLAAITLIGLANIKLSYHLILRAASLGGIVTILISLNELDEARINWGVGLLDSGYASVLLLGLAITQFHMDKGKILWRGVAVVGIFFLIFAVMKTGTRGAWLAMICVFLLQFLVVEMPKKRKIVIAILGLAVLGTTISIVPSFKIRVESLVTEMQSYFKNNDRASSVGYRLDFWQIAMRCFSESPVWGVSYQRRSKIMKNYIIDHPRSRKIGLDGRSSSHNEIFDALAKKGLLGGSAILLLYFVPLGFFIRHIKARHSRVVRHLAFGGIGFVVTIIVCGLTEAPMMSVRIAATYAFGLVFFYHLIKRETNSILS